MAENQSSKLDAETLTALCARLSNHADGIVNVAAHEMEQDTRQAARALALFATLKFRASPRATEFGRAFRTASEN